jgi:hypothetical protein
VLKVVIDFIKQSLPSLKTTTTAPSVGQNQEIKANTAFDAQRHSIALGSAALVRSTINVKPDLGT